MDSATGSPQAATALIALDWGTSSLRAYRMDAQGRVLERRHSAHGITQLPQAGPDGFEQALQAIACDWLSLAPRAPLLACGMVGSAQGWREAPYAELPMDPRRLAGRLAAVPLASGRTLLIVPGLIQRGALPNVMRGEETQIVGALALGEARDMLVGLPGSHSKWARVADGCIVQFDTYMTGEAYAALSQHTILARTVAHGEAFDAAAFDRGLDVAPSAEGRRGLLSTAFSTRTLGLTGALDGAAQADYLSGLLIGYELQAVRQTQPQAGAAAACVLIGDERLCARYAHAMARYGLGAVRQVSAASEAGLWRIAVAAGLAA